MSYDDVIYVTLLAVSIGFGKFYRQIDGINEEQRKWVGTAFGLFIVFVVSGWHALHPIVSCLICGLIILYGGKKKCHLYSFVFMFSYLLFFRTSDYFGISLPPGHTNMIQMILVLKVVGLAFEINTAYQNSKQKEPSTDEMADKREQEIFNNITLLDIFHYSFNYVGVLTGPYFRYRTFVDYFSLPFKDHANSLKATINKLMWVPLFAAVFLTVSYIWPLHYATNLESDLYVNSSVFYRLMYVWPTFIIFRMRIYIGITLSECVCTMAGFGAYPIQSDSAAGGGPKKEYLSLTKNADKHEYDFETIHNVDAYTTDTCWTFREAMKSWNMCVQYWLAVNVYKRFPSKAYRTLVTLLVSALWHGVYPGYYFCIVGAPFYLPIEDIYHKLVRKDAVGVKRTIIDCIFWISKFFAFSYLGISFLLLTMNKIWFYYSSIYHLGYVYFAVMYIVGRVLLSMQKRDRKDDKNFEPKPSTSGLSKQNIKTE